MVAATGHKMDRIPQVPNATEFIYCYVFCTYIHAHPRTHRTPSPHTHADREEDSEDTEETEIHLDSYLLRPHKSQGKRTTMSPAARFRDV